MVQSSAGNGTPASWKASLLYERSAWSTACGSPYCRPSKEYHFSTSGRKSLVSTSAAMRSVTSRNAPLPTYSPNDWPIHMTSGGVRPASMTRTFW